MFRPHRQTMLLLTNLGPTMNDHHNRRSIRLKGYDYTQPGAYFITICTHERAHLFGHVEGGDMVLSEFGETARQSWLAIPNHFPHAALDAFVVMPNHVHGVIWIVEKPPTDATDVRAKNVSPPPSPPLSPGQQSTGERPRGTSKTSGSMVRGFKIGVTKWARQHTNVYTVWQRNYYEHIIRNDRALHAIRRYIVENPRRWQLDRYNPDRISPDSLAQAIWNLLKDDPNHAR